MGMRNTHEYLTQSPSYVPILSDLSFAFIV